MSQVTNNTISFTKACSDWQQKDHQSFGLMALCEENPPVTCLFPNGPVMRKVFPCDDVNMSLITVYVSIAGELSSQKVGKVVKAFYLLLLKKTLVFSLCCQSACVNVSLYCLGNKFASVLYIFFKFYVHLFHFSLSSSEIIFSFPFSIFYLMWSTWGLPPTWSEESWVNLWGIVCKDGTSVIWKHDIMLH